jgi:hypothetical protein
VERELIITYAGHIAHRKAFPRSNWREGFGEDSSSPLVTPGSDLQSALRTIDDLFGVKKICHAYHAFVEARAEHLIQSNWERVEHVTAALLERKRLSVGDVKAAMYPELAKYPVKIQR